MRGNQRFHKDVFELVKKWTNEGRNGENNEGEGRGEGEGRDLGDFDEEIPMCRAIMPAFLLHPGRYCNPF
jgi:hypothetical protein